MKKSIQKRYWADGKDCTGMRYELIAARHIMFTQSREVESCVL